MDSCLRVKPRRPGRHGTYLRRVSGSTTGANMQAPWSVATLMMLSVWLGCSSVGSAEPITVAYDVHVSRRAHGAGTEPFTADFVLEMRFDPASGPISCPDDCPYGISTYGPVSF